LTTYDALPFDAVEGDGTDSSGFEQKKPLEQAASTSSDCTLGGLARGLRAEQTMGQRVMGHGSNGSTNVNGSHGSWVSTVKQLTYD